MKMLYFILLFMIDISWCKDCQISPNGKCFGNTTRHIGAPYSLSPAYNSTKLSTFKECIYRCINDSNCKMSIYQLSKTICWSFSNSDYTLNDNHDFAAFKWQCCDISKGDDPKTRCRGFWGYRIYYSIYNNYYNYPLISNNISKTQCQELCLKTYLCGAVNIVIQAERPFEAHYCELIINFPIENIKEKFDSRKIYYKWMCVSNYSVPKPNSKCTNRNGYSYQGYWYEISRDYNFNSLTSKAIADFFSYRFQDCLKSCVVNPFCQYPLFSQMNYHCILIGSNNSLCSISISPRRNIKYIKYHWMNCTSKSTETLIPSKITRKCRQIKRNDYIEIGIDNCGSSPTNENSFQKCNQSFVFSKIFSPIENCLNNQAFQIVKFHGNYINIFTGFDTFWLRNFTDETFPYVSKDNCDKFNSNPNDIYYGNKQTFQIITRDKWFALPPKQKPYIFYLPLKYIVISDVDERTCNCYDDKSCSHAMREIQFIDSITAPGDIKYNFIITGDGSVYEGTGFKNQGDIASIEYNAKSIQIGLAGKSYEVNNIKMQSSLKLLIGKMINLNIVDKNYTLVLLDDIFSHESQLGLKIQIKLWPHYKNHNLQDCFIMGWMIFSFNLFSIMIIIIPIIIIYKMLFRKNVIEFNKESQLFLVLVENNHDVAYEKIEVNNVISYKLSFTPKVTSIYFIERKSKIVLNNSKCCCKKAIFSYFNIINFTMKSITIYNLININEFQFCLNNRIGQGEKNIQELNAVFINNDEDFGISQIFILHKIRIIHLKELIYSIVNNQEVSNMFVVDKYFVTHNETINTVLNLRQIKESVIHNKGVDIYYKFVTDKYGTRF